MWHSCVDVFVFDSMSLTLSEISSPPKAILQSAQSELGKDDQQGDDSNDSVPMELRSVTTCITEGDLTPNQRKRLVKPVFPLIDRFLLLQQFIHRLS